MASSPPTWTRFRLSSFNNCIHMARREKLRHAKRSFAKSKRALKTVHKLIGQRAMHSGSGIILQWTSWSLVTF